MTGGPLGPSGLCRGYGARGAEASLGPSGLRRPGGPRGAGGPLGPGGPLDGWGLKVDGVP